MTINTFLHISCLITIGVGVITLILNILNKSLNIYQKINSSIYLIILCAYVYISETLLSFLKNLHVSTYKYNEIFLIILTIISLISILTVLIGTNLKNNQLFEKYIYKAVSASICILSGVLTFNLFYSNKKSVFLFPILLICFILTETFVINSTEKLNNKTSIAYYFVTNTIFSCFWLVEFISLCKSSKFSSQFLLLFLLVLIVCFSSIVLGIFSAKKEYKK